MKKVFILSTMLMTCLSFADSDLEKLAVAKIAELAEVGSNGGEAQVLKYDVKKFNQTELYNELKNDVKESECAYEVFKGVEDLISAANGSTLLGESEEAMNLLIELKNDKKIKGAVGYTWDGSSGDSEYCSTEIINIYFEDGTFLSLSHDSTT